jgi:Ca2+-binding EF-hand superfamily protein
MTRQRPPKKTDTLEVRMAHDAKRAFLEACAAEDRSASEVVRGFIESYIARAAARARLREQPQTRRSIAMIYATPQGRRGLAAAAIAALGAFALVAAPSAAELDFRAMFDGLDADRDGQLTVEEFAAGPTGEGDVMVFMRAERVERTGDGVVSENSEEFWLPAAPPTGSAPADGPVHQELRVTREVQNGEVVTERIERGPLDEAAFAGLRRQEFSRFDDDGDGAVDFVEFETRHTAMISNTFRRLDANGDGRLAAEEFDAFPVALGLGDLPPPAPDALTRDGFARLDRDGDGAVTLEEFASGPPAP